MPIRLFDSDESQQLSLLFSRQNAGLGVDPLPHNSQETFGVNCFHVLARDNLSLQIRNDNVVAVLQLPLFCGNYYLSEE